MSKQSDVARRAAAIEHEFDTRTSRLADIMKGEFDQDDAKEVTDKSFHEIIRRNWTDPLWRVKTAQRMGPVALYKAALDAFGRSLDGSPSKDSHEDAQAAEPAPSQLRPPTPPKAPKEPMPNVFPFQGPPQTAPQPVPVMPMPMPPPAPMPPPGMPGMPPPQMPPPQIGPPPQ